MQFTSLTLFSSILLFSAAAYAESTQLPKVVVSANRMPTQMEHTGSAVTVITGDEMRRRGITQVFDVLKTAPGVTVNRNGGIGGVSGVRIRGSNPGQVRVMMDGVLLNDTSNVDGSFDFNSLTTDNIERIEIVRGPQSALYGSDAMGGVINIITRKGGGTPQHSAFVEAGSFHTLRTGVGSHGTVDKLNYGVSARHVQTKGFSHSSAGNEKDGADQHAVNASLGYALSDSIKLDASGGYSRIYSDFDPSATQDGDAFLEKQVLHGRVAGTWLAAGGDWENTLSLEGTETHRSFDQPVGFYRYSTFDGTTVAGEYQSTLRLRQRDALVFGLRSENQRATTTNTTGGATTQDLGDNITNNAVFGQYLLGLGENTTLTAGGRVDDHELFGTQQTYRVTATQEVPSVDARLHASVGTGFKAPTLYQLYSSIGNADLQPEESIGYDAGIRKFWLDDRLQLAFTGFYNRYENLIDYDFGAGGYININEATTYGLESELRFDVTPQWTLTANHTYLRAVDDETDAVLPRRPKHAFNLGAQHHFANGAHLGADIRYLSRQLDSNFSTEYTKAFTTVDIHASTPLNDKWELYGRVDNLLDRDYQEALNFNAAGISGYAGLRVRF